MSSVIRIASARGWPREFGWYRGRQAFRPKVGRGAISFCLEVPGMRVRVYDPDRKGCFCAELYALFGSGIYEQCLVVQDGFLRCFPRGTAPPVRWAL